MTASSTQILVMEQRRQDLLAQAAHEQWVDQVLRSAPTTHVTAPPPASAITAVLSMIQAVLLPLLIDRRTQAATALLLALLGVLLGPQHALAGSGTLHHN